MPEYELYFQYTLYGIFISLWLGSGHPMAAWCLMPARLNQPHSSQSLGPAQPV